MPILGHEHDNGVVTGGEAWLRALVEGMPQMIWRAVDRGSWTWSSPQWERYTGQSVAVSSGDGWLEAIHPEDRELARRSWSKAPACGGFHADLRIVGQDGQTKWFQTRGRPIRDDDGRIVEWIGTSTDVDDLRQLQAEQRVLVAELQHRTRNLIAVVHSISVQTARRATSLDDFQDRFEDRLSALSRVQGLLSTAEHDPITIGRLITLELNALAGSRLANQVSCSGPETVVRNSTAQTLALAVHELTTNALKYGALSTDAGRLTIHWREHDLHGQPWLRLEWEETDIPEGKPTGRKNHGYGRVLIEKALPRQLGAETELTFGTGQMRCMIDLPLKASQLDALNG